MVVINRIVWLLLLSFSIQAQQTLTIVSSVDKPPYILQKENSGFEIELVQAVIQGMGKSAEIHYENYGRTAKMFEVQGIDAIMTASQKVFTDTSVLTLPYINYQNVAISLAENNLKIEKVADLAGYSMVSFQLADKVLGQAFLKAAMSSPMYAQMGDQSKQPGMLFRKRTDVLVMDKMIFYAMLKQSDWAGQIDKVKIHPIFPVTAYSMAFKDKQNVSLFNAELIKFLASNDYMELRKKYDFD
ncbi:ABC transporter substrate-binding protein [uncultured Paraglaciecola sp.]|uniref:substrate-binding periplasmic protein n=1 Tax=uncultured Paraglaciecola sp. TaxID=1765024 RepID=UPI0026298D77|nr:transporter substrate-binding domain-containing protein [uncultured Paraglaciecola sp.]